MEKVPIYGCILSRIKTPRVCYISIPIDPISIYRKTLHNIYDIYREFKNIKGAFFLKGE